VCNYLLEMSPNGLEAVWLSLRAIAARGGSTARTALPICGVGRRVGDLPLKLSFPEVCEVGTRVGDLPLEVPEVFTPTVVSAEFFGL
jgi:hypothetical protein